MGININDLNYDPNKNLAWQTNDVMPTENIRELTEQEQQVSGGGTGNFSLTVTDGKGKTLINEKKTFNTGSLVLDADLDVIDSDESVTVFKAKPNAIYYPNIIGFAYFFDDDDDDTSSESGS